MCQFVPQQEYKRIDFKDLDQIALSSPPPAPTEEDAICIYDIY